MNPERRDLLSPSAHSIQHPIFFACSPFSTFSPFFGTSRFCLHVQVCSRTPLISIFCSHVWRLFEYVTCLYFCSHVRRRATCLCLRSHVQRSFEYTTCLHPCLHLQRLFQDTARSSFGSQVRRVFVDATCLHFCFYVWRLIQDAAFLYFCSEVHRLIEDVTLHFCFSCFALAFLPGRCPLLVFFLSCAAFIRECHLLIFLLSCSAGELPSQVRRLFEEAADLYCYFHLRRSVLRRRRFLYLFYSHMRRLFKGATCSHFALKCSVYSWTPLVCCFLCSCSAFTQGHHLCALVWILVEVCLFLFSSSAYIRGRLFN